MQNELGSTQGIADHLSGAANDQETIILPTGQLYMEALKGEATLLEDFKLAHRGLDVLKVQEEVRESRLENLRFASRMIRLSDDQLLDDPQVEKTVVIKGGQGLNVGIDP